MMHRSRILRWRTVAVSLTALAVIVTTAGCGIAADGEPTAIDAADLPADLLDPRPQPTTTIPGSATTASVTVYFLTRQGEVTRLTPAGREVASATRAADRIKAVLAGPSEDEQRLGLISTIPTDTVLLDTTFAPLDGEVVVNLSGALFDVQGKELAKAFAQLVWTVTEIPGVRQVRFKVDGQAYRTPDAEGIEQDGAVTRGDYNSLAPAR